MVVVVYIQPVVGSNRMKTGKWDLIFKKFDPLDVEIRNVGCV